MAIDYRLRYFLAVTGPEEFVASPGAAIAELQTGSTAPRAFLDALPALVADANPVGRVLAGPEELRLARACVVLALLEECYRTGMVWPTSPLASMARRCDVEGMLAIAPETWAADVSAVCTRVFSELGERLTGPMILNPTFVGSAAVGGADADLVLSGTLIDIKATVNPRIDTAWVLQVLGYTLLDWDDACGIGGVGLLLARQARLNTWRLDQLLDAAAGPARPSLAAMRASFAAMVGSLSDGPPTA